MKRDNLLLQRTAVGMAGKETIMKMVTIVCRETLEDYVLLLFTNLGIKGYTVVSGTGGSGKAGAVSGTHGWSDRNTLFLVALDDDQMAPLINAVKEFHAAQTAEQDGREVPLKMFLQPCELIL